jgi:hypothetical protein
MSEIEGGFFGGGWGIAFLVFLILILLVVGFSVGF